MAIGMSGLLKMHQNCTAEEKEGRSAATESWGVSQRDSTVQRNATKSSLCVCVRERERREGNL